MRDLSSARHLTHIPDPDDRHVTIEDPLLPAAVHLTSAAATEVLRPVVAATGGELLSCRTSHVQYRPESDLVVRYRCEIRRGGIDVTDNLLAATTVAGPFAGTLPVEAEAPDGSVLSVGVWRWPFDPILVDLTTMVTPRLAHTHLGDLVGSDAALEVVAYRPTERAVVRVRGTDREIYVKVVPPAATAGLVRRHVTLADAGLPVPRVLAAGNGWIAMESLVGTTLRDRLKNGADRLPPPDRYRELLDVLSDIDLGATTPARSRLADAPHHAAMLGTVLPEGCGRLHAIVEQLTAPCASGPLTGTVHGDLHEGPAGHRRHVGHRTARHRRRGTRRPARRCGRPRRPSPLPSGDEWRPTHRRVCRGGSLRTVVEPRRQGGRPPHRRRARRPRHGPVPHPTARLGRDDETCARPGRASPGGRRLADRRGDEMREVSAAPHRRPTAGAHDGSQPGRTGPSTHRRET
jgi:hypothetical protein